MYAFGLFLHHIDNVEVLNYEGTYMIGRVVRNNVEDLITLEINDISSIKQ